MGPTAASSDAFEAPGQHKPAGAENSRLLLHHGLLSLATALTFSRALPYPLQRSWDDGRFIVDNPLVQEISLANLAAIFARPHFEAYHPLHLLSYWLDVPWVGPDGPTLHATNLLLWIATANLLLMALRRMGLSAPAALIGALLCALHPAQVEVVSWATGRKDILAMAFVAAAMALHLRSERFGDRPAWGSRACYLAALLSKTTAIPLPLALLAIDRALIGRSFGKSLRHQLPNLLMATTAAIAVVFQWRHNQMLRGGEAGALATVERFVATVGHQLATALWPAANSPMYHSHGLSASPVDWLLTSGLLLLSVAGLRARVPGPGLGAALALFFLLPVSNLVPMYFPLQDRYLSLPLLGLALALASALDGPGGGSGLLRRAPVWLSLLAAAALALRSVGYQAVWSDELRLWGHAVHTRPDAYYAWMKLGELRRDAGRLDGAVAAYGRMVQLQPRIKLGHAALMQAVVLRDQARRGDRAAESAQAEVFASRYHAVLDSAPGLRPLAAEMLVAGYTDAALLALERALQLEPVADETLERAAAIQLQAGRAKVARFYLSRMGRPPRDPRLQALTARSSDGAH
ncbi:MAG: hypothetical protein OEZ06_06000 [Myxococcales bacterium]|nr:hypothetical protein [Myxococcales bacterium]